MQSPQSQPRPAESKTLGIGPESLCFNPPSRWFWCVLKVENHCFTVNGSKRKSLKSPYSEGVRKVESTAILQRFSFASGPGKTLLSPHRPGLHWRVPGWEHVFWLLQAPFQRPLKCSCLCLWSETNSLTALGNKITFLGDSTMLDWHH